MLGLMVLAIGGSHSEFPNNCPLIELQGILDGSPLGYPRNRLQQAGTLILEALRQILRIVLPGDQRDPRPAPGFQ